jgi:hypothetical protein
MKNNNKIILQYIKQNKTREYKSLKALALDFSNIEYHQLREIYLMSMGKTKRKLQKFNLQLYENIRIIDNPEYYKSIIQNEEPLATVELCVEPLSHHQQCKVDKNQGEAIHL